MKAQNTKTPTRAKICRVSRLKSDEPTSCREPSPKHTFSRLVDPSTEKRTRYHATCGQTRAAYTYTRASLQLHDTQENVNDFQMFHVHAYIECIAPLPLS